MKINRKNRIIITDSNNNNNFIFISSKCKINNNKPLNLNKTKLFYIKQNTFIVPSKYKKVNLQSISNEFNIDKQNILEIINIYKNNLFIILLDFNATIPNFKEQHYLDLFKPNSESIYNDIYNYNTNYHNCYLNQYLTNNSLKIKLIDLYYYLIGYI
jgi:hypothetical protein